MGGRLLKKTQRSHLDEIALDDAADGYTTKGAAKHLKRCIHCRGQVRCIKKQREAEKIIEEDDRRQRERMRRQAQVSYNLNREPPMPLPDLTPIPGPRLLSGSEWVRLKRWTRTPAICIALLSWLIISMTRPDPEDRHALLMMLLIFSACPLIVVTVLALEQLEHAADARDEERGYQRRSTNP